jgi:hypothetical protein
VARKFLSEVNVIGSASEEYLGFRIEASLLGGSSEHICAVYVTGKTGTALSFTEVVDPVYLDIPTSALPKTKPEFRQWLMRRGASRARGAIALDRLGELTSRRFVYSEDEQPDMDDQQIQRIILRALRRIQRLSPQHSGRVPLDPAGICLLEGIAREDFDYVEKRLRDKKWTTYWSIGSNEENYNVAITEEGLQALEHLEAPADGQLGRKGSVLALSNEYFVAHEFSREQIDDLRHAISEALGDRGLTAYYADTELREGHIFRDKIIPKIQSSRFGIYEVSNPNKPNVFLELGAAIALGRPHVIICKMGTAIPADLAGLDRIEYASLKDLTEQLREKLTAYL